MACRKAFGIPDDAFVFGRISNKSPDFLAAYGWPEFLFHSFERLAAEHSDLWLVLCGLSDCLLPRLAQLPAGIRNRVVLLEVTDQQETLQRYYWLMDAFLHATRIGESFGLVLCEAMLSGIPILTINTPLRNNGQIEVVAHGKTGLVVDSSQKLYAAMERLYSDRDLLQQMSRQARPWVVEQFDIPGVVRQVLRLAPVALTAASSQELAAEITGLPGVVSHAPAGMYRELLQSAGIKLSLWESFLTAMVNRPISRWAIGLARKLQAALRG
jgi:hypothetical protein